MATRPSHLDPFEAAVLATVRERRLFGGEARVLVALSGGADSVALLAALAALRGAGALEDVSACHVDHQLRPGSDADGVACAALCAELEVPLVRTPVTVPGGENVQQAARRERYRALRAAAALAGASRIATGHTMGDQAETVLLRLLRGAGARGLSGIPPRRGT
ncbi:MAG TPA: tRNA lysidine(34) synthetase TilS, partial [Anaeromyxobacteraceae bacterium]